ncbi:MAG: sodium:solute symporter [Flavobacteriaceae bacterium]
MHILDWIVLVSILVLIVGYGVWKTRSISKSSDYLSGGKQMSWYTIGLSVMATQASAITFLSTPGQAYLDGMGFAQFYFGLPLAMIILCVFVLPIYYRSKVTTAYEYLENRFDLKTRTLTAFLFLLQRGLAAGITIYAPAIILSAALGWNLTYTNIVIGTLVIIYTVSGGTRAVSQTQKQQMLVILIGMGVAFGILMDELPTSLDFNSARDIAGNLGKFDVVDFDFDLSSRYNIWTALLGGTFLFLSYFGTDQSQVQRYLGGRSLTESRLGLLFNAVLKVPMQFGILLVGVMVFVFYQFNQAPLHFNNYNEEQILNSEYADQYIDIENAYTANFQEKKQALNEIISQDLVKDKSAYAEVEALNAREMELRNDAKTLITTYSETSGNTLEVEDTDYVFFNFIITQLPRGIIGLLLAVIFSAAMSSTASELNALSTTTVVDVYKRSFVPKASDEHYLKASKWFTFAWGVLAILFATTASLFDNLIEAVNIIGSLFYGSILGVFVLAFFMKKIGAHAAFFAVIIAEFLVISLYALDYYGFIELAYLWLNAIGCLLVLLFANILHYAFAKT